MDILDIFRLAGGWVALMSLAAIWFGWRYLTNKDWAWARNQSSKNLNKKMPKRTPQWERYQTYRVIFYITVGILAFLIGSGFLLGGFIHADPVLIPPMP